MEGTVARPPRSLSCRSLYGVVQSRSLTPVRGRRPPPHGHSHPTWISPRRHVVMAIRMSKPHSFSSRLAIAAFALIAAPTLALAQGATQGTVTGRITDAGHSARSAAPSSSSPVRSRASPHATTAPTAFSSARARTSFARASLATAPSPRRSTSPPGHDDAGLRASPRGRQPR